VGIAYYSAHYRKPQRHTSMQDFELYADDIKYKGLLNDGNLVKCFSHARLKSRRNMMRIPGNHSWTPGDLRTTCREASL